MNGLDWELLSRLIAALATLGTATAGFFKGSGAERSAAKEEAELLALLPTDSDAYRMLAAHVTRRVERLTQPGTRDWPMFVVALLVAPVLGWTTIWLVQRGTMWSWLLAPLAGLAFLIFLYGLFETAQKVSRDTKGKRLD